MSVRLNINDCSLQSFRCKDMLKSLEKIGKISTVVLSVFAGLSCFFASFFVAKTGIAFSCTIGFAGVGVIFVSKVFLDCCMGIAKRVQKAEMHETKEKKMESLRKPPCEEVNDEKTEWTEEEIARQRARYTQYD